MHPEARISPLFIGITAIIAAVAFLLGTLLASASPSTDATALQATGLASSTELNVDPIIVQPQGIECLSNNGFLDFQGITHVVLPATPHSCPAFSTFNAIPADNSYSFSSTRPSAFSEDLWLLTAPSSSWHGWCSWALQSRR
jgi:hypothetical protein